MQRSPTAEFECGAIQPLVCIEQGVRLGAQQYGIMLGVSLVAMLMCFIPVILYGPAACGLSLCAIELYRGRPVQFDLLFRGFDRFMDGLIVSVVIMLLSLVVILPAIAVILFVVAGVVAAADGGHNAAAVVFAGLAVAVVVFVLLMVVAVLIQLHLCFAYPLLVDRNLDAKAALSLSARAVWANIWGLIGLYILLTLFWGIVGTCLSVLVIFLLPFMVGILVVAYRQVFPEPETSPPPLP